uniref:Uncharacterized protein n=1 Tax=Arundo donax TaxID=35708 RepID=A0A0A8Z030_ARUDO
MLLLHIAELHISFLYHKLHLLALMKV